LTSKSASSTPATEPSHRYRCDVCIVTFDSDADVIGHNNEVHAVKGDMKYQVPMQFKKLT
jgi:hypothetical protein